MSVEVKDNVQRFYTATTENWEPLFGHKLIVEGTEFAVCPRAEKIDVFEVTSGTLVTDIDINKYIEFRTRDKTNAMLFFAEVGEWIKDVMPKYDFSSSIQKKIKETREDLGDKPETEDVTAEELNNNNIEQ